MATVPRLRVRVRQRWRSRPVAPAAPTSPRAALVAALLATSLATLVGGGCSGEHEAPPLQRSGPLGTLRDLVLFDRSQAGGGPFFLDRFEATRGDFAEFAVTAEGALVLGAATLPLATADDAALPMAGIDLAQARAFARWRRCRLPRSDEWTFACTADGHDTFPWGSFLSAARANTSDLGVFAPLPVGTFESGRSGDGPYDLIGNVAEWTETVPGAWFHFERDWLPPMTVAARRAERTPGLSIWRLPGAVPSLAIVVAVAGADAPREVLGADFTSSMRDGPQLRSPRDRGGALGVRLCTTPTELLPALVRDRDLYGPMERRQIERFCRRGNHAAVLRRALAEGALPAAERAWFEAMLP